MLNRCDQEVYGLYKRIVIKHFKNASLIKLDYKKLSFRKSENRKLYRK